jgi:integration host factor subunit alpha
MTLSQDAIISAVAKANGYHRPQATQLVETLLEIIKSRLSSGEDVLVSGFRKFCINGKRERRGRNPATGEDMTMKARRIVRFKWSGKLRRKINQSQ